jgi:hypothetical protein
MAGALSIELVSLPALAHDPLEATATARIHPDRLTLQMTLGSWRASRACKRTPLEACSRGLYRITSDREVLPARSADAVARPDGDLDVTVIYPAPSAGRLRLTAAHLQRHPEEMTGASLAVYRGEELLTRRVLDAENASVEINLPAPRSPHTFETRVTLLVILAAMFGWFGRRAASQRRSLRRPEVRASGAARPG